MMHTPWGEADSVTEIAAGVREVSTPSHGGIMVHEGVAAFLSEPGRKVGERYGPWLCFEEDCAYAAVYLDCPALWRAAVRSGAVLAGEGWPQGDAEDGEIMLYFQRIIYRWFPDAYGVPCQSCEAEPHGICRSHGGREALTEQGQAFRTSAISDGNGGVVVSFQGADGRGFERTVSTETYRRVPLGVLAVPADYGLGG